MDRMKMHASFRRESAARLSLWVAALILICQALCASNASAQILDFSDTTFTEPVDGYFWERNLRGDSIEIGTVIYFDESRPRAIFHWPVTFWSSTFDSMADFWGATFNSRADFFEATFHSHAVFKFADFKSKADFLDVTFHSKAGFRFGNFDSTASFSGAEFDSTADFGGTDLFSTATFQGSKFNSTADFVNAIFHSTADFHGAEFNSTADFRFADLSAFADFRWVRFGGPVYFNKAILPDTLDFRWVTEVEREVDFTYAQPPSPDTRCLIALIGADISKIKLRMGLFRLWFPEDTLLQLIGGKYDTLSGATTYDHKASIFESVLKKLKDDGFTESYQILDIDYRRFKAEHQGGFNWYFLDTWQDWWWNYGYTKERIVLWTIGLWALISCINLGLYRKLNEHVYTVGFLESERDSAAGWVSNLLLYTMRVVTYTALIFFGLKMSVDKFSKGVIRRNPWLFCYLMVVYLVGLVCLGFIANMIFAR